MNQIDSKIRALIAEGEYSLAEGPHPERARPDAETLLLHVLRDNSQAGHKALLTYHGIAQNFNSAWLIANRNLSTLPIISKNFKQLIMRRRVGEPIQYITGETEFYGLTFRVTQDVLIPRPETEHLVEKVIELAARFQQPRVVDVGTGSGAIAVALAHKLPHAQIAAIDICSRALTIVRENAKRNGVDLRFILGDLLMPVAGEKFEFVVSNPPYVPSADRATLSVEVRKYEPELALFAGDDGLDVYRRLIPAAFDALTPGGFVALEIGFGQSPAITELLARVGFEQIEFVPDLQGIPRVACARRT
ncbi:MAG: peptide chain release factor N(5)-glutamine methyltransferase [Terracidiphilus sp.]